MGQGENWRTILIDGTVYERRPDGTLAPVPDRMDYERIDRTTDDEIKRFAAEDADGHSSTDAEWAQALDNRRRRRLADISAPVLKIG